MAENNKVQELMNILVKYGGKNYKDEDYSDEIKSALDAVKNIINEITSKYQLEPKIVKYNIMNTSILKDELWFSYVLEGKKFSPISISIFIGKSDVRMSIELDNKNTKSNRVLDVYRKLYTVDELDGVVKAALDKGFCYVVCSDDSNDGEKINSRDDAIKELQKKKTKFKTFSYDVESFSDDEEFKKYINDAIGVIKPIYDKIMPGDTWLKKELDTAFNEKKQVVLTGAPGTGKTHTVIEYVEDITGGDEDRAKFVQFHPSFDYTDFVEGLRPVVIKRKDTDSAPIDAKEDNYSFVRVDGVFKKFCRNIIDKGIEEPCFFVIDEINRADLSKVFGELMYSLEESYRAKKPFPQSQYSYLPTYKIDEDGKGVVIKDSDDKFKDGFFIPENVYIIGTMNDIDRSVESFDFALRRRFKWIDVGTENVMKDVLTGFKLAGNYGWRKCDNIKLMADCINNMNKVISGEEGKKYYLSKAYNVGPSYFKVVSIKDKKPDLGNAFKCYVEPILREYLRSFDESAVIDFIGKCKQELLKELK